MALLTSSYSTAVINSPVGHLSLKALGDRLVGVSFASERTVLIEPTGMLVDVASELAHYFANPTHRFAFPYRFLSGSEFQHRVWQTLTTIPAGETRTYGDLAVLLETSPRSIGQACRHNPLPLIIPCHRVVGTRDIGGFMGKTTPAFVDRKQYLLTLEKMLQTADACC